MSMQAPGQFEFKLDHFTPVIPLTKLLVLMGNQDKSKWAEAEILEDRVIGDFKRTSAVTGTGVVISICGRFSPSDM